MGIKLTKNEQKKQKDSLKQYQRYLPTLQLKKKQLQSVIRDYQKMAEERREYQKKIKNDIAMWISLYAENAYFSRGDLSTLIKKKKVHCTSANIAGVDIPVFDELEFEDIEYDLEYYPLWVDKGIEMLKSVIRVDAQVAVLNKAVKLLEDELTTTTQRVNLFEKVKIPEATENIRKIAVALQDQQTASVVRGKIAKKKLSLEK